MENEKDNRPMHRVVQDATYSILIELVKGQAQFGYNKELLDRHLELAKSAAETIYGKE